MSHNIRCLLILIQVYRYENGDGVGKAVDLVLQGFTRFVTRAIIPVVVCALVLYMLVRHVCISCMSLCACGLACTFLLLKNVICTLAIRY